MEKFNILHKWWFYVIMLFVFMMILGVILQTSTSKTIVQECNTTVLEKGYLNMCDLANAGVDLINFQNRLLTIYDTSNYHTPATKTPCQTYLNNLLGK